jgi:hypothetical protein
MVLLFSILVSSFYCYRQCDSSSAHELISRCRLWLQFQSILILLCMFSENMLYSTFRIWRRKSSLKDTGFDKYVCNSTPVHVYVFLFQITHADSECTLFDSFPSPMGKALVCLGGGGGGGIQIKFYVQRKKNVKHKIAILQHICPTK